MKKYKKMFVCLLAMLLLFTFSRINASAYNGYLAAQYAGWYWNSTAEDHGFAYYSGGDCTNFVSQCVYYGGTPMKKVPTKYLSYYNLGKVYTTKNYWSSGKYRCKRYGKTYTGYITTSPWSNVDAPNNKGYYGFQDFMNKYYGKSVYGYNCKSTAAMQCLIRDAKVGDVVQIKYWWNNRYSHSYLVGAKRYNKTYKAYDIFFYAHTGARDASNDDSLWFLLQKGKIPRNARLALIKM